MLVGDSRVIGSSPYAFLLFRIIFWTQCSFDLGYSLFPNLFDLLLCGQVPPVVVDLRSAGVGVPGDGLGHLELFPVVEIGDNAGPAEGMAAYAVWVESIFPIRFFTV